MEASVYELVVFMLTQLHYNGNVLVCSSSLIGYSLLPIVGLSALAIVFPLKGGLLGTLLSMGAIGWSTYSATR